MFLQCKFMSNTLFLSSEIVTNLTNEYSSVLTKARKWDQWDIVHGGNRTDMLDGLMR